MSKAKGIRRTPRDLEGAVYEIQMARDKLSHTTFMSDNRIYKSGRNSEENKHSRYKDFANQDAGEALKKSKKRASSKTSRDKDPTTPSPRVGKFASAPVDVKMHRMLNSSHRKETKTQSKESASMTPDSSINKVSLRVSPDGSSRSPITTRNRARVNPPIVPTSDENPKLKFMPRSGNEMREYFVNNAKEEISNALVNKSNKLGGLLSDNNKGNLMVVDEDIGTQSGLQTGRTMGKKSAGVSTGARRSQKTQNTSKNIAQVSPFSAMADVPVADKFQESPKTSSEISLLHQTSLKSQASNESLTFWPKTTSVRSEDVPYSPVVHLDKGLNNYQMEQHLAIDYHTKSLKGAKRSQSRASKDDKDSQDSMAKFVDRTFGLSFGRKLDITILYLQYSSFVLCRKSKNLDLVSPRSTYESDSCSTKTKKSHKLPKLMRSLGKALSKRLLSADDHKSRSIKRTLKKAFGSRKSRSSDDGSDTASSIDMNEIQVMNPELYTTILETVASWCEEPIAEPDAESDALSARTFSSISFRNQEGHEKSQDLTNFDLNGTLAAEEAFLEETIKENKKHLPNSDSDSDSEKDKSTKSEFGSVLTAGDKLCLSFEQAPSRNSQLIPASPEKSLRSHRLAAFLELADSDTDEEDEVAEKKALVNSFLHLTSSELEPFETKGMKEVLRMQGIWIFDWEQCEEMKSLPEEWHQSSCLRKYLNGCRGFEISIEGDKVLKSYVYPVESYEHPMEKVFLDKVPGDFENNITLNIQGTLTTMGLRTTCVFTEDHSYRQELFCLDKQGLCVQVSAELANGNTSVSKVFLKRLS
eukprot:g9006.t1